MTSLYPEGKAEEPYLRIDVTLDELHAFNQWAEDFWQDRKWREVMKRRKPGVVAFIELMGDCESNYEIRGDTEFLLDERLSRGRRGDGPVRLEDYLDDDDAQ